MKCVIFQVFVTTTDNAQPRCTDIYSSPRTAYNSRCRCLLFLCLCYHDLRYNCWCCSADITPPLLAASAEH